MTDATETEAPTPLKGRAEHPTLSTGGSPADPRRAAGRTPASRVQPADTSLARRCEAPLAAGPEASLSQGVFVPSLLPLRAWAAAAAEGSRPSPAGQAPQGVSGSAAGKTAGG